MIVDLSTGIEVVTRGVTKNVECLYIIVEPTI